MVPRRDEADEDDEGADGNEGHDDDADEGHDVVVVAVFAFEREEDAYSCSTEAN